MGHSKVESVVTLEAELGDRISCTKHSNTSVGAAGRGYPTPAQRDDKVQVRVTESILEERKMEYLIYQIDK